MIVNVDMDGVIYDFVGAMFHEYRLNGFDPGPVLPEYSLHTAWGTSREKFEEIMFNGIIEGRVFGPGLNRMIPGARDALATIREMGHWVRIVTLKSGFEDRHIRADAIRNMVTFLEREDIPYDDLCLVQGDKLGYPAAVVIDDRPQPTLWAQRDAHNLLFDQPHNRILSFQEKKDLDLAAAMGIGVERVAGWDEVVALFEKWGSR